MSFFGPISRPLLNEATTPIIRRALQRARIVGNFAFVQALVQLIGFASVQAQVRVVFRRVSNRFGRACDMLRPRLRRGPTPSISVPETSAPGRRERDVPSAFLWASARYHPRPYRGPV